MRVRLRLIWDIQGAFQEYKKWEQDTTLLAAAESALKMVGPVCVRGKGEGGGADAE